jgi:hypothetical protein
MSEDLEKGIIGTWIENKKKTVWVFGADGNLTIQEERETEFYSDGSRVLDAKYLMMKHTDLLRELERRGRIKKMITVENVYRFGVAGNKLAIEWGNHTSVYNAYISSDGKTLIFSKVTAAVRGEAEAHLLTKQ